MLRTHFPQLEDLQIHFPSTVGLRCQRINEPNTGFRSYCQTTSIDWIMKYAFKDVKHIKKTTLIGYIKTAQKDEWEKALQDQYIHGIIPIPLSVVENDFITYARANYPPRCVCKFPCILPYHDMDCKITCRVPKFARMNPDLRNDGDCRCFWFDKDDRGWDGYLEWCKMTKGHFDVHKRHEYDNEPSFHELDDFQSKRDREAHPECEFDLPGW